MPPDDSVITGRDCIDKQTILYITKTLHKNTEKQTFLTLSYFRTYIFSKSEEKWSLVGVVRCFCRILENYDCRTKFNSSLGMEYNSGLYGFSAVKVKLVDSLI